MEEPRLSGNGAVTILDVLGVDICQRAILDKVPFMDILRSERVSRRWQHIVLIYLQNCRNLTLEVYEYGNNKKYGHRSVKIYTGDNYPLPIFSKTVKKLGSLIVRLKTNVKEEFYETIASNCPHLRHVELNYSYANISEKSISDLIRNKDLETIKLEGLKDLKGDFLNSLESDSLRCLSIVSCRNSKFDNFCFNDWRLRNVTNLQFDFNAESRYWITSPLFLSMPNLDYVSFTGNRNKDLNGFKYLYTKQPNVLKRLNISSCFGVNSSILKGLAGCSNLEYLNIRGCSLSFCSQGLEALIQRPAVTWLCLGFIKNVPYEKLKQLSIITELERCGCNYVTPGMLKDASLASRGQKHALEFIVNYPAKEECSELKIILGEFFECRNTWSDNED